MKLETAVGLAFAVGVVVLIWVLAGAPKETAPQATQPASESAPAELEPEAEAQPEPEPERPTRAGTQDLRRQLIPVLGDRGIAKLHLSLETHPEPRTVVRIITDGSTRHLEKLWKAHVTVARFIAFDGVAGAPAGLRIQLETGDERPGPDQIAALAMALRMAAADRPYPMDQLVAGIVAPDRTIVSVGDPNRTARIAEHAGLALVQTRDFDQLLARWAVADRPDRPPRAQPAGKTPEDLYAVNLDDVRVALRKVLGGIKGRRPNKLEPPRDWREVGARAEGRLATARVRSLDELVTTAIAGAQVRAGLQFTRFAATRVLGYSQRLIRDETPLEGWPMAWLTALVTARVDGERLVRDWPGVLPPAAERPRLAPMPTAWMRARGEAIREVIPAFTVVLEGRVPRRGAVPRAWPHNDVRNLAWPPKGAPSTRAAVADWGMHLQRLGTVWSQLLIALVLKPEHTLTTGEHDALRIVDRARLSDLVRVARRRASDGPMMITTSEGTRLTEVRRILGRSEREAAPTVSRELTDLEQLWLCSLIHRDARRISSHFGKRRGDGTR